MPDSHPTRVARARPTTPARRALLAAAGLLVFHLSSWWVGKEDGLWLPALGLGIALVAWLGQAIMPLLALDLILVRFWSIGEQAPVRVVGDGLLLAMEMGFSWWVYAYWAKGNRRLEDPRAATIFLIVVPGVVAAAMASVEAGLWRATSGTAESFWPLAGTLWISRALGILAVALPLLVVATPFLIRHGLTYPEPMVKLPGGSEPLDWTWGEIIETAGLCMGADILALVLVYMHMGKELQGWSLWGISLLLVVWAGVRQGLRGGSLTASSSAVLALALASYMHISVAEFSPLQGNLLAQCSTALLVGSSAGWIRASEARYRQMVGHIPVVLYSARMPRGFEVPVTMAEASAPAQQLESKADAAPGRTMVQQAEVTLVSPASRAVFGCPPEDLLGPYAAWLERIDRADRELVIAALSQLVLQRQPVVCEYRVVATAPPGRAAPAVRWVRDTLVAFHVSDNSVSGWEGVIEDITEQRSLALNLRRTNGMLQALVTYLPTGVFFVQGPIGQPILVNQRARQLLGRREDLSAGIAHLSEVYHLHRPDGSQYPVDELPVAKALRLGTTQMANDIVVHRADGGRLPIITWAAPVNWTGQGNPDAAVWVLEDLTTLQQAETARHESEARLRVIIETMAEGVIVQNQSGFIMECNPAAGAILGMTQSELVGRAGLGPDAGCVREDGTPFPRAEQPDLCAVGTGAPVRNVIMGIPAKEKEGQSPAVRWILVSAMPLPVGHALGPGSKGARVVTTFADITAHRQALAELQRAQRLELVARLASGTVHDFNNLLTVMIGLAGLAQASLPVDHPAWQDLERLTEAGEQAAHLAGQMLTFSKLHKPAASAVDVNAVVIHSLKLLKGALHHGIRVEKRLEGDVLLVHADEVQLKQVVMNLCLNSRDAMARGGVLTVSTEKIRDDSSPWNNWVRLAVQDTGHGIDAENQERIFEPFFSTKERGTGLGLAVVRQIIESLGGCIQMKSKADEGTRMEVILRSHAG